MGNLRNHRNIKLLKTNERESYDASQPNYYSNEWFAEDLLATEMNKRHVRMFTPIYLGMSIIDISKTLMYEFHCSYLKPKYDKIVEILYMGTDTCILHIKTDNLYEYIKSDVKDDKDDNGSLPTGINKKVAVLMKDDLGEKNMMKFVVLSRATQLENKIKYLEKNV